MTVGAKEPGVREIHIHASPETVFEFFVDADKLTRWLATAATLGPRLGGACIPGARGRRRGPWLEFELLAACDGERQMRARSS